MIEKIKAWIGKLLNSLDPSVALHSATFLVYAAAALVMMCAWFIIELVRSGDLKTWSGTMEAMLIIAGGSHVAGTLADKIGNGGGDQ